MNVESLSFAPMKEGEEAEVSAFVSAVFADFVAAEYPAEGVEEFHRFIAPDALRDRCQQAGFFLLCCRAQGALLGVLAVRDHSHISLMFVRRDWQQQGIARRLLDLAIERCRAMNRALKTLTVFSAPFAVPVYEQLGFAAIGPEQQQNGIRFRPMRLDLPPATGRSAG
jgi:GNAT superfamily N-acetyltransferase